MTSHSSSPALTCQLGRYLAAITISLPHPRPPRHPFPGKLSEGAESTVFRGTWRGQAVAVKKARISASVDLDRFKGELAILARLQHPAVVPLLGGKAS